MSNVQSVKKPYATPQLVCRGDIATLTQTFKQFGIGDGFVLITPMGNIPITNVS
jgi:hypothetical protein